MDYSTLKANVSEWLARSDLSDAAVNSFVELAEARISRSLRIAAMERPYFRALDANSSAPVPASYIEFKEVYLFAGTGTTDTYPAYGSATRICRLQRTSGEELANMLTFQRGGDPYRFARLGTSFVVGPQPSGEFSIGGVYYAAFASLTALNPTSYLTDNAPDLLLSASLSEAAAYIQDQSKVDYWTGRFNQILTELQLSDERERASGSQIVTFSGVR